MPRSGVEAQVAQKVQRASRATIASSTFLRDTSSPPLSRHIFWIALERLAAGPSVLDPADLLVRTTHPQHGGRAAQAARAAHG